MRNLSSGSRRINNSEARSKSGNFDPTDSWEGNPTTLDEVKKIINLANQKSNLLPILKKYNIRLINTYDVNGWEYKANCPFPHHNDNTPSFGYNTKEDRFFCFGCRGSGRTVEFLSLFHKQSKLDIAKSILESLNLNESDYALVQIDDSEQINKELFDFAKYLRDMKNQFINDEKRLKHIENIIYCSDMYLFHAVSRKKIKLFELKTRITKYKEFLERLCAIDE